METFVAIVHIITAVLLVVLVVIQDTKSGTLGSTFGGGGGSSSLLGATGAVTLANKATRWAALVFAITSISLSIYSSRSKSVIDNVVLPPTSTSSPATIPVSAETSTAPAPEQAPAPKAPEQP